MDDLAQLKKLAGIQNFCGLQEYKNQNSEDGSNISKTANEKIQYQKQHKIQPGTPEWFKLWFSKPYLTGEKPW